MLKAQAMTRFKKMHGKDDFNPQEHQGLIDALIQSNSPLLR
jgi:hypothetical protein